MPLPAPLPLLPGAAARAAAAGSHVPPLTQEDECVVCLSAHRTVILAPCGHRAACEMCSALLLAPLREGREVLCPLCRTAVESSISLVI